MVQNKRQYHIAYIPILLVIIFLTTISASATPARIGNTATVEVVSDIAPIANDQTVSVNEDSQINIDLLASDEDDDPLSYSIVTQPIHGIIQGSGSTWTYTPNQDFNELMGEEAFTFLANDGQFDSNVATVTINVTPVNDKPVAGLLLSSGISVSSNSGIHSVQLINVMTFKPGPTTATDEATQTLELQITEVEHPDYFEVMPAIDQQGVITFKPAYGKYGYSSIKWIVKDNGGRENGGDDDISTSFYIDIQMAVDTNHPPTVTNGSYSVNENSIQTFYENPNSITGNIIANDEDGDTLTYCCYPPEKGVITIYGYALDYHRHYI